MELHAKKYLATARTALRGQTNGGIVYILPNIALKIVYLVPLMFIWRLIAGPGASTGVETGLNPGAPSGVEIGMSLTQLLTYTYMHALLTDMLNVHTYMTDWDFDSKSTALFTRPMPVFGQVIARTAGDWAPMLLMFSLPMAIIAPLLGIQIIPRTLWVLPSIILCASLGFAFEFCFFCVTLRVRNVSWLTNVIRTAVISVFSGAVIPFKILPFGMDKWMGYQPFGSLGAAPLSLHVGTANPATIIPMQVFWNVVFWSVAIVWFGRSRERLVSFGG